MFQMQRSRRLHVQRNVIGEWEKVCFVASAVFCVKEKMWDMTCGNHRATILSEQMITH